MNSIVTLVVATVAGFLTRPCCVIPAVMSVAGVGSAGLASSMAMYRPAFLGASVVMLGGALWLTFRRPGGVFIKVVSAAAALAAFGFSMGAF